MSTRKPQNSYIIIVPSLGRLFVLAEQLGELLLVDL